MIKMVNSATNNVIPVKQYPARKWDTKKRLLASIELASKLIDYKPLTSFSDGLLSNMQWFKNNWDQDNLNYQKRLNMMLNNFGILKKQGLKIINHSENSKLSEIFGYTKL